MFKPGVADATQRVFVRQVMTIGSGALTDRFVGVCCR